MNFYPFHIGDYASATRHLTWLEDVAYRRLLDTYYVREGPLPCDKRQVYRLLLASSEDQRDAVDAVLAEFFVLSELGYAHKRCDLELAAAQDKSAKAAKSARARWGDAKDQEVAVLPASSTQCAEHASASLPPSERTEEACVRDAPKTNPKTNPKEATASKVYVPPEWVPAEPWAEFVAMRRAMRNVPFTGAAARGVVSELDKFRQQGHDPAVMLRTAVTSGWRTVYAPKVSMPPRPPASGNKFGAAARAIFGNPSSEVIDVETH